MIVLDKLHNGMDFTTWKMINLWISLLLHAQLRLELWISLLLIMKF